MENQDKYKIIGIKNALSTIVNENLEYTLYGKELAGRRMKYDPNIKKESLIKLFDDAEKKLDW